jgi:hypothetical protein
MYGKGIGSTANLLHDFRRGLTLLLAHYLRGKGKALTLMSPRTDHKAKARTKDLTCKAKARTQDCTFKARTKNFLLVLKESLRPGPRPRTNITIHITGLGMTGLTARFRLCKNGSSQSKNSLFATREIYAFILTRSMQHQSVVTAYEYALG